MTGVAPPAPVVLGRSPLSSAEYESIVYGGARVALDQNDQVMAHRRELERQVEAGCRIYAVNTGYGSDAGREHPTENLRRIQLNTIRSHAVRVGDPVPCEIVRGMLLIKAQAYVQGPAAVRPMLVDRLIWMLNQGIHPVVYSQGSQSASGDLIPNAQLGLGIIGEGEVCVGGEIRSASEIVPELIELDLKEGVTLTNDVSLATALAFDVVRTGERLVDSAELIAAMTLQAMRGYPDAYDERLVARRPHRGAIASAAHMRALLVGSELVRDPGRRHDPYSLRCLPQVHGAVRDALAYASGAVDVEIRSVGDNPLVFPADKAILSGGNFHGAPIVVVLDALSPALTSLAALAQRRIHHLVNSTFDVGLPKKLAANPDEQLGLLLLNTAAASLVSECAALSMPVSVTSIGIDEMEDHVSMAAVAARKLQQIVVNVRRALAFELLCAAQALDFQRPARATDPVEHLHASVRQRIPFLSEDVPIAISVLEDLV
jgi:histidine ammonia-lyase